MRSVGISLVIGFALGAVTIWLAGGGLTVTAPVEPELPAEPGAADPEGRRAPPDAPEIEPAPDRVRGAGAAPDPPNERTPLPDLVARLAALARRGLNLGGVSEADTGLSIVRAIRGKPMTEARIPREVVRALLAADSRPLVWVGLSAADLSDPPLAEELAEIARNDPEAIYRAMAVMHCAKLFVARPELREVVIAAAEDPSPRVRSTAVGWMGQLLWTHGDEAPPAFTRVVLAATRDPDRGVRENAMSKLSSLGRPGAVRAVELIREGVDDLEILDSLAAAAASWGLASEALGPDPSPELVTCIIQELDWQDPEAIAALRGRFGELLPLFQPSSPEDFQHFFHCALAAGESTLALRTVSDNAGRESARLFALLALLETEEHVGEGLEALRVLIWADHAPARLQRDALGHAVWNFEAPGEHQKTFRRLLDEVIASHGSQWVRQTARECLESIDWSEESD